MSSRLSFRECLTVLLLVVGLQGMQFALVEHGIEHAFHEHEEACVECLSLPGMQAVPVSPVPRLPVRALPQAAIFAVPPAPTIAQHLSFQSRAPPLLQSC